jgi:hypothetical protein
MRFAQNRRAAREKWICTQEWWPETLLHCRVNLVFIGEMRFREDYHTPKSTPILPRLHLVIPLHAHLGG